LNDVFAMCVEIRRKIRRGNVCVRMKGFWKAGG
jgi:hypothetical protein